MSRLRSAADDQPAHKRSPHEDIEAPRAGERDPAPSVLEAAPGNASVRLARRLGDRSPILVFCLTVLAGYLVLAALTIALGFLLVDVLLPIHAIGDADEAAARLARRRTAALARRRVLRRLVDRRHPVHPRTGHPHR